MTFQVSSLARDRFEELFQLDDEALSRRGMKRYVADKKPGFPCRVSLEDAEPGERVLLLPFEHQYADSPYHASGPIFVREQARNAVVSADTVPALLRTRLLSVRAYDGNDLMIDADVVEGRDVEALVARFLDDRRVSYLHVHFARPGCYACRIDRA
jgi:Protein of unknown function (DUF1203)